MTGHAKVREAWAWGRQCGCASRVGVPGWLRNQAGSADVSITVSDSRNDSIHTVTTLRSVTKHCPAGLATNCVSCCSVSSARWQCCHPSAVTSITA